MRNGQNLRKHRHSYCENVYSITTCTNHRQPFFLNFNLARTVIRAMRYQDQQALTESIAFVVMPDHVHWLFRLEQKSLDVVLHSVKSFTAHQFGGHLWQEGYHEYTLRSDDDLVKLSRYIVANPLRAGLVQNIEDYSHWDAVWLNGPLG